MTLREWLTSAPFTLTMSSGFFGFYAHAGVVRVLEEERLLPARATGSSAGALIAGLWAAGLTSQRLTSELTALERRHFWDPGPGIGLLRGRLFRALLEQLLPVTTFAECSMGVAVSTFDVLARRTHVIDSGKLAPALQASCTVPLLFHPVRHAGRVLWDGGILDRPGLAGVPAVERVFYHHLTTRVPGALATATLRDELPRRSGLVSLVIETLPKCDPFRLENGRRAMELAASALRRALDRPLAGDLVQVR
jgi:NTE family protein